MYAPRSIRHAFVLGLAVSSLLATGCSVFKSSKKQLPGEVAESFEGQKYILIVKKDGRTARKEMEWKEGMTLQDVLKQSGLRSKFRDMDLAIKRPTEDPRKTIPFSSKYDKGKKMVEPVYNYAVHPNDFVIVSDASKGVIDELIDSAVGSLWDR